MRAHKAFRVVRILLERNISMIMKTRVGFPRTSCVLALLSYISRWDPDSQGEVKVKAFPHKFKIRGDEDSAPALELRKKGGKAT